MTNAIDRALEFGRKRLELLERIQSPEDWEKLWPAAAHEFPFEWGSCWKQCTEYAVEDFAAEVGFFFDVLGLPVNALAPDYAMFTSPDKAFFFAVVPASEEKPAIHDGSVNLGFMVQEIERVAHLLAARGVDFHKPVTAHAEGSPLHQCAFRSPNGIEVMLWGMREQD